MATNIHEEKKAKDSHMAIMDPMWLEQLHAKNDKGPLSLHSSSSWCFQTYIKLFMVFMRGITCPL